MRVGKGKEIHVKYRRKGRANTGETGGGKVRSGWLWGGVRNGDELDSDGAWNGTGRGRGEGGGMMGAVQGKKTYCLHHRTVKRIYDIFRREEKVGCSSVRKELGFMDVCSYFTLLFHSNGGEWTGIG